MYNKKPELTAEDVIDGYQKIRGVDLLKELPRNAD